MIALLTGCLAGMAHVVTGPDHLVALLPVAADRPKVALKLGLRWGLGHGIGVLLLGALGWLAKTWIDVDGISSISEILVGITLVGMGFWSLRRALGVVIHTHSHDHEGDEHGHLHVHDAAADHDRPSAHGAHTHATLAIGFLHGTAGTGHLLGALPALALPTPQMIMYLTGYIVFAGVAMGLFGWIVGSVLKNRQPIVLKRSLFAVASLTLCVGFAWTSIALSHHI